MKILRKWLLNWIKKAHQEHQDEEQGITKESTKGSYGGANILVAKSGIDGSNRINFSILPAAGGVVITINKYDRQKDHHVETLHVIHDDEDVATNIGHIVSMELLRHS